MDHGRRKDQTFKELNNQSEECVKLRKIIVEQKSNDDILQCLIYAILGTPVQQLFSRSEAWRMRI